MAIKRYLSNDVIPAGFTLPAVTGWTTVGTTAGNSLTATPLGVAAASTGNDTVATNPNDVLLRRFVSDPMLSAGSLSGAWTMVLARQSSNSAALFVTRTVIRVTSGNGTTSRGTAVTVDGATWTTALLAAIFTGTMSAITCQVGDRIVMELGVRAANTVTTSYTATVRRGGTSVTDLQSGDASADSQVRPAHITFTDASADARFTAPPPTGPEPGRLLLAA